LSLFGFLCRVSLWIAAAAVSASILASCAGAHTRNGLEVARFERLWALEWRAWLGESVSTSEDDKELREALASLVPELRAAAVRTVARTGPELQRFMLLACDLIQDCNEDVRRETAFALGLHEYSRYFRVLEELVQDVNRDPGVRHEAARFLGRYGAEALPLLLLLLRDPSAEVRRGAVLALADAAELPAAAELAKLLEGEHDERVRWGAALALSRRGAAARDAGPLLEAAASDPNFLVSTYALDALRKLGPPATLEPVLAVARDRGRYWPARRAAVRALASWRDKGFLAAAGAAEFDRFLRSAIDQTAPSEVEPMLRRAFVEAVMGAPPAPRVIRAATESTRAGPQAAVPSPPRIPPPIPEQVQKPADASDLPREIRWHNPRLRWQIGSAGEVVVELFFREAPRHVAALLGLATPQRWPDASLLPLDEPEGFLIVEPSRSTNVLETETRPLRLAAGAGGPAELPPEPNRRPIRRGTLLELPEGTGPGGPGGALFIAAWPLPELEGRATVVGQVALGQRVLDGLSGFEAVIVSSAGLQTHR
jgi:cyclophilin family peptidyl-prolyl cis-trans isomerase